jgi:membrane protease YdiL (CAAX protease family)
MQFLLCLLLAALFLWNRRDLREYAAFRLIEDSARRRGFYWRWTVTGFLGMGLGSLLLLLAMGRLDALTALPTEFAALRSLAPQSHGSTAESALGFAAGLALGSVLLIAIWTLRLRKVTQPVVGDVEPLMPRNYREVLAAVPLAINAGISEELFFRLVLPLVATLATGSALAGFLIAGAAFGLAHWYQGWKGILAVTALGAFLTFSYLSSGSLVKPMMLHVLIDLVALVLRPAITLWINRARRETARPAAA